MAFVPAAITSLGYTIINVPAPRSRFGYATLRRGNTTFFAKFALSAEPKLGNLLQSDIWWHRTFATRNMPFKTPAIADSGADWYVSRFIQGKPCVTPEGTARTFTPFIPRFVDCLVALDALDASTMHPPENDTATYNRLDARWQEWSKEPLARGLLTTQQLTEAQALIAEFGSFVRPSLQHGDFVPWHFLHDNGDHLWLIDGEHGSAQKPRFYDLAYMATRVATHLRGWSEATMLIREFVRRATLDDHAFYQAFLPVLTTRAIGVLYDSVQDLSYTDYRREAKALLAACLSRDPSRLLG